MLDNLLLQLGQMNFFQKKVNIFLLILFYFLINLLLIANLDLIETKLTLALAEEALKQSLEAHEAKQAEFLETQKREPLTRHIIVDIAAFAVCFIVLAARVFRF